MDMCDISSMMFLATFIGIYTGVNDVNKEKQRSFESTELVILDLCTSSCAGEYFQRFHHKKLHAITSSYQLA